MPGNISCVWCPLLTFFEINFLYGCQTVRVQIRIDILSVMISGPNPEAQTACKGYQQTLAWKDLWRRNSINTQIYNNFYLFSNFFILQSFHLFKYFPTFIVAHAHSFKRTMRNLLTIAVHRLRNS